MHLSAITQNNLQGGKPVYATSASKLHAPGNRTPTSHELTVDTDTPKSAAIFLRGILFLRRQALKAVAKLARTSHLKGGGWATAGD